MENKKYDEEFEHEYPKKVIQAGIAIAQFAIQLAGKKNNHMKKDI